MCFEGRRGRERERERGKEKQSLKTERSPEEEISLEKLVYFHLPFSIFILTMLIQAAPFPVSFQQSYLVSLTLLLL